MKIAYIYDVIYPYVKGGAEKRFWELAKRLSKSGHQVHLYGMKSWDGEPCFIKEGVHIHGIGRNRKLYLENGIRDIRQISSFTLNILPALMKERFDIIDCNAFLYLPFFPVKLYCLLTNTALVITWQEVWAKYWYSYLGPVSGLIGRIIEKLVIILSDNVIVHSRKTKDALYRHGFWGREIKIISHGIETKATENIPASMESVDLLFTGRLIKDKNVDLLIRALELAKKELPNINCLIIGEGPERDRLITLRDKLGLTENIRFQDFLEYQKLIASMKAARIFVFPSTREGFGIVVLEAMAASLPVITVEHPMNASTELVRERETGYICSPIAEDIAAHITGLLKDEATRARMAQRAKELTREYDWDRIVKINEDFYKDILKRC